MEVIPDVTTPIVGGTDKTFYITLLGINSGNFTDKVIFKLNTNYGDENYIYDVDYLIRDKL